EKGSNRGRDLKALRDAAYQEHTAEDREKYDFVRLVLSEFAQFLAIPDGDKQNEEYCGDSNDLREQNLAEPASDKEHCDDRQIDRHHKVFKDENRKNHPRLRIVEKAKLRQ